MARMEDALAVLDYRPGKDRHPGRPKTLGPLDSEAFVTITMKQGEKDALGAWAKAESEEKGKAVSVSALVRRIVRAALKRRGRKTRTRRRGRRK